MRSTKVKAAEHREQIIAAAAQEFRARGFAGIGVADLMRRVGLTHGGFYAHFESKSELMELACRRAVSDMLDQWQAKVDLAPGDAIAAIVRPYLSAEHRDQPATGCLMATLGPEAAREGEAVRRAVSESMEDVLNTLSRHMGEADSAQARRQAILLFATLVGAMVAARAASDQALSDELLATVADALLGETGKVPARSVETPSDAAPQTFPNP